MRAVFTGKLQFGMVSIDIKLYTAQAREETIKLRQLDKETLEPVRITKSSKNIVRGYDCGEGSYVIVENVLEKARKSESIEIQSFVPIVDLPLTMLDKSYFIESSATTRKAYSLLNTVLDSQQKVAIAKMVLRGVTTNVAIMPQDSGLVAFTLKQVRKFEAKQVEISDQEIDMAEQLVESMTGFIGDVDFSQPEQDTLKNFIQERIQAGDIVRCSKEETKVVDIQDVLKKAIG